MIYKHISIIRDYDSDISELADDGVASPSYFRVAQRIQALMLPLKWLSALARIALAVASSTRSRIMMFLLFDDMMLLCFDALMILCFEVIMP